MCINMRLWMPCGLLPLLLGASAPNVVPMVVLNNLLEMSNTKLKAGFKSHYQDLFIICS